MWDVQPGEFWAMTVQEWFWEYDVRVTDQQAETFSGPDWDRARAEHRKKMNDQNCQSSG